MPEPDFKCHVCGIDCDTAPDPPAKAICPDCCEDHDYQYEREERAHVCTHCGKVRDPYFERD